jgi:hypothetical protein
MRFAILGCAALLVLAGCEGLPEVTTLGLGTGGGTNGSALQFSVEPAGAAAGGTMPAVQVTALTTSGVTDTSFVGTVMIAIGTNPSAGSLGGITSVAAAAGVATFNNLTISKAGNGYTLVASSSGLTSATSSTFDITP